MVSEKVCSPSLELIYPPVLEEFSHKCHIGEFKQRWNEIKKLLNG